MCVGLHRLKQIKMAFVLDWVSVAQYLKTKNMGGCRCHSKERLVQSLILGVRLQITPGAKLY